MFLKEKLNFYKLRVILLAVLGISFTTCFGIIFFNENINSIGFFGTGSIMLAAILPSFVKYVRSRQNIFGKVINSG